MSEQHADEKVAASVVTTKKDTLSTKDFLVPGSIIIAGIFIGVGLFFSGGSVPGKAPTQAVEQAGQQQPQVDTTNKIAPVTEADHIRGDVKAPVKIVEFSDFECPFCKRHHETLKTVMTKYEGKVAWVYRQFPLEQLHPVKAMSAAMASECVAELGGNDAFWIFTDRYFEETLTNNRTDIDTLIPKLVAEAGVNAGAFSTCFEEGRHKAAIEADIADAVATGGQGTPWSVIIGPSGKTYPLNGALPANVIEQIIEQALSEA